MLNHIKQLPRVGFFLILLFSFHHFTAGQNKDVLDQKVDYDLLGENIYQNSGLLSNLTGIPIGIEAAKGFDMGKNEPATLIKKGSLREVLDSVVRQDPDYKWELRDGVINIYPDRSRDRVIESLLETKSQSFSSKKDEGRKGIVQAIDKLDEVNTLLNANFTWLTMFVKADPYLKDKTTDLDISNTDLRGILNRVIKESGDSKVWIIRRDSNGSVLLTF